MLASVDQQADVRTRPFFPFFHLDFVCEKRFLEAFFWSVGEEKWRRVRVSERAVADGQALERPYLEPISVIYHVFPQLRFIIDLILRIYAIARAVY
jgi:hypothetical protein